MKIIHTADLHLGQIIYQNYDRVDEHEHFFGQLESLCQEEKPDALILSGDVFDIQQPSASVKKAFTEHFVKLHTQCPSMKIVITAGNHDSASSEGLTVGRRTTWSRQTSVTSSPSRT